MAMRATINIPDKLLEEVQELSGEKSKTKAITTAIKEYIKNKRTKELLELKGKIKIDYDWEKEEEIELGLQDERERFFGV